MNSKSKSKIQMEKFSSLKNLNFFLKYFDLALKNLLKKNFQNRKRYLMIIKTEAPQQKRLR